MNVISRLAFGFALLGSASAFAADVEGAAPAVPPIILAASSEESLPLGAVLELEPGHLLTLGVGVLVGAVVVAPYMVVGEVVGVAVGLVAGELLYRSGPWPLRKSAGWFRTPGWFE